MSILFSNPLGQENDGSFCFCFDYRALNATTILDHFSIPTANELFDELGVARVFTKLDLHSGYHQIRMHDRDPSSIQDRILDPQGHYELLVMHFSPTNALSTSQACINLLF